MKLIVVLSILFLNILSIPSLYATNPDSLKSESSIKIHPLRSDRWAIMLKTGINDDYSFSFLSNREISFKYQLSRGHAVRFDFTYGSKVQFTDEFSASDYAFDNYGEDYINRTDFKSTNQEYMYSGNLLYLDYKRTQTDINFYYGAGLFAFVNTSMYDSESYKNSEIIGEKGDISAEFNQSTISLGSGLSGLIGLEYFITDFLSLTTEYKTALYYQHIVSSSDRTSYRYPPVEYNKPRIVSNVDKGKSTNDSIRILIPQFTLGLQLYF